MSRMLDSVGTRHANVRQHQVGSEVVDGLQGRRRAVGRSHLGRSVGQGVEERLPNGCVVVDDQDAAGQNARPVGRVGARSLISQGHPIIAWPRTLSQSFDPAAVWVQFFSRSRGRLLFSAPLAQSAVHPRALTPLYVSI